MRILLVEDEPILLHLAARGLEHAGYQVIPTTTAEEALDLAAITRPDLLMTDILLPGMDGIHLVQALRTRYPELAVLVWTGLPGADEWLLLLVELVRSHPVRHGHEPNFHI